MPYIDDDRDYIPYQDEDWHSPVEDQLIDEYVEQQMFFNNDDHRFDGEDVEGTYFDRVCPLIPPCAFEYSRDHTICKATAERMRVYVEGDNFWFDRFKRYWEFWKQGNPNTMIGDIGPSILKGVYNYNVDTYKPTKYMSDFF